MSISEIGNLAYLPSASVQALESRMQAASPTAASADFSSWLSAEVDKVNGQVLAADKQLRELALGGTQNLHEVMIAVEEAKLSLQLMVQIRNRALEAYQDVLRMQI
jgi:flagellar hook-basal body complex protein FliE